MALVVSRTPEPQNPRTPEVMHDTYIVVASVRSASEDRAERLGHADIAMTLNRYSHVTPDMQRSAADTLDAAFTMVS